MNNSASESGVRGREQHPNLTEVEKIKAVKGKMNDALFEFMQCATVLGLSCFVMMSTGKDGEITTVKSLKETVGRVHVSVVDDSKSLWLV